MKNVIDFALVLIFISQVLLFANDASFTTNGNQLIPLVENEISITKEILTLTKKEQDLYVDVYYEFFNPSNSKELLVGFEAPPPSGDSQLYPQKNGEHPYINDFTVTLNNQKLKYKISYVTKDKYIKNNKVIGKKLSEIRQSYEDDNYGNYENYKYVYHFKANFLKGKNIIQHRYKFVLSNSVMEYYNFDYILTAANRWANKQIDDFTLNINIGEFESFNLYQTFFDNKDDWKLEGRGNFHLDTLNYDYYNESITKKKSIKFNIINGTLTFKKSNFKPKGELILFSQRNEWIHDNMVDTTDYSRWKTIDYINKFELPLKITEYVEEYHLPNDELSYKILKNLPFARRGYIFTDTQLKKYYDKVSWYIPDLNYTPNINDLTVDEKKWLAELKSHYKNKVRKDKLEILDE